MDRRRTRRRRRRRSAWPKVLLCLLIVGLLATAAWGWFCYESSKTWLELKLLGQQQIVLEYGQSYEEPGAEAWLCTNGKELSRTPVHVTQTGSVDDQKIGTYVIEYTASCEGYSHIVTRTVQVVDTQLPQLTLIGGDHVTILPNEIYQEAGFTAVDNYDGDLTDQVRWEQEGGVITYTVTDSSGNTASATRTITVDDPIPPVVKLTGGSSITVGIGAEFADPGYTATDNYDGDLTDQVQVSGSVDAFKEGTYTLTYTVTDSYQNTTTVSREVCVLPLAPEDIGEKTGKVIYLTFDDGPGKYTEQLLDILAKYNVKVTFFVVETKYMPVIQRAAEEGHTVAIHTATHRFDQVYASDEAYFEDLYRMQSVIEKYTGIKSMMLRFPGGSSNAISKDYSKGIMTRLTAAVTENGFTYFDWNVDSDDAGGAKTAEQVFNNVIRGIGNKDYAVVLQHDIKEYSVEAVERIIIWGLKNGYTFLPLTEDSPTCHHGLNN